MGLDFHYLFSLSVLFFGLWDNGWGYVVGRTLGNQTVFTAKANCN